MSETKCQECGHRYEAHHPDCHHALVRYQNGVEQKTPCTCEKYVGIKPDELVACPHEFLPHSNVCVACEKTIQRRAPWSHPQ